MHPANRLSPATAALCSAFRTVRLRPKRQRMEEVHERGDRYGAPLSTSRPFAGTVISLPLPAPVSPADTTPIARRPRAARSGDHARPRDQRQRRAAQRSRPGVARVRHPALYAARDHDRRGPNKRSSIGSCAKRVTKRGIPSRSAC